MAFRVDQIDHAELTVPDRHLAAAWYEKILGLNIIPEYQFWADDPGGPLMIGTVNGATKLALFTGDPSGSQRGIGFHLVAFRVDGKSFMEFLQRLDSLQLKNRSQTTVLSNDAVDHGRAFSLYFVDPWGHELEITTYEADFVRQSLV